MGERQILMNHRLHMRRCHVCNDVNVGHEGELIHSCSSCGKPLIPWFYFDESRAIGIKTEREAMLEYKSSALPWREYPPILGLTAYWES